MGRGWQNQLGYVRQMIYLIDDTLRRIAALGIPDDRIDEERVRRAIRLAQLEEFVGGLSKGLAKNEQFRRLSASS